MEQKNILKNNGWKIHNLGTYKSKSLANSKYKEHKYKEYHLKTHCSLITENQW